MRETNDSADFAAAVHCAYVRLVDVDLPAAGRARGWPWTSAAEFESLLQGHLSGDPAARPNGMLDEILAIDLGERLLRGNLCWTRLRACELRRLDDAGKPGANSGGSAG